MKTYRARVETSEPTQGLRIVGPWETTRDRDADGSHPIAVLAKGLTMNAGNRDVVNKVLADAGWERVTDWTCGYDHYCVGVRAVDVEPKPVKVPKLEPRKGVK